MASSPSSAEKNWLPLNIGIKVGCFLLLVIPNVVSGADLLFSTQAGANTFFRLTTNGAVTSLGTVTTQNKGLAYVGSTLFSLDRTAAGGAISIRGINPNTGNSDGSTPRTVTMAGGTVTDGFGLASHPQTGILFAIVCQNCGTSGPHSLVTINPANGVASLVGNPGIPFAGLAFNGAGTLYGVSASNAPNGFKNRLYILNQSSAARTFVLSLANTSLSGQPHAIGFHRQTNRMYHFSGASGGTYEEINLSTLQRTPKVFTSGVITGNGMALTARRHQLQVSITGSGTVTSSPSGINCGGDCSENYDDDQLVTLTPTPAAGQLFSGWSGACTGSGSCAVTMSTARLVGAAFAPIPVTQFSLQVIPNGTGSGNVSSTPGGISCGGDCGQTYNNGTNVVLTTVADAGSTFAGWSGEGCSGTGSCAVTMTANRTVTATFNAIPRSLVVNPIGTGSGTVSSTPGGISCGSDCGQTYNNGTNVVLTAVADAGSTFAGWSGGGCSGTGSCAVTMTADRVITATFNTAPAILTVMPTGSGTGVVTSSPTGINCGMDCEETYSPGTIVTLTATPSAGSVFGGWTGPCTGTGLCVVTMTESRMVGVVFSIDGLLPDSFLFGALNPTDAISSFLLQITADGVVTEVGDLDHRVNGLVFLGSTLFSLDRSSPTLRTINASTGATLSTIPLVLPGIPIEGGTGLALDPTTNILWGLLKEPDQRNRSTQLVMIAPGTGVVTPIRQMLGRFADIAFDSNGNLFAISGNRALSQGETIPPARIFTVDKGTGVTTEFLNVSDGAVQGQNNARLGETIGFGPVAGRLFHLSGQNIDANGITKNILFESIDLGTRARSTPIPILGSDFFVTTALTACPSACSQSGSPDGSDVNGDGREDFVWHRRNNGATMVWQMTATAGRGPVTFPGGSPLEWALLDAADVNGDGRADFVWRNTTNGATMVWQMTAAGQRGPITFPGGAPLAFELRDAGDVNGDGRADFVWRNTNNGATMVWQMTAAAGRGPITFPGGTLLAFELRDVADVNGDGRADFVWHRPSNGATMVWQMTAAAGRGPITFPGGSPVEWALRDAADVNGDGRADFVWRNTNNGATMVWQMTAAARRGPITFPGGVTRSFELR